MEINLLGFVTALTTFFGIAFGHLAVRWIEFRATHLWTPMLVFGLGGLISESLSLLTSNLFAKSVLGILGMLFFWDAIEVLRQQNRVRRGHAKANPRNPRHRRFLEAPASAATTLELLKDESSPNG
ncbi:MAG: hypothetical protein Kow0088_03050 [Anaerolineales bacterium]